MRLPQAFVDEINSYGAECLSQLAETLAEGEPSLSVRVNRAKGASVLDGAVKVDWCDDGFYLDERPRFTFDPRLHQGLYYVQDASSMAITHAIKRILSLIGNNGIAYLDACAAPGGKTTAALSVLPEGSVVVANEFDYRRADILAENVAKWGAPNVIISRGDTSRLSNLKACFDIIAADVPCSGEGMMRKDAEAVSQWSPTLVNECVARQKEIIGNLWPALRPGGFMIYSTCTFNRHENEEMVDFICSEFGGETVDIGLDDFNGVARGIDTELNCYRFIPGKIRGEGLFISVIRKSGDGRSNEPKAAKKPITAFSRVGSEATEVAKWLEGEYKYVRLGDEIMALPKDRSAWMTNVMSWLDVISAGVRVATIKGRDIIPDQGLALSTALRKDAFPTYELDLDAAINYLRREAMNVEAPRGYVLMTYQGCALGFVKNLGSRANNLYPQTWRILSAYK